MAKVPKIITNMYISYNETACTSSGKIRTRLELMNRYVLEIKILV